jgi:hypothetical protein
MTYTSLILDVTNSPSDPLLISVCILFHKLSNFYNELLASYYIFSLKLQPLLWKCKAIWNYALALLLACFLWESILWIVQGKFLMDLLGFWSNGIQCLSYINWVISYVGSLCSPKD